LTGGVGAGAEPAPGCSQPDADVSGQRCASLKEHADETQEVAEQLGDASKTVPRVPKEVEDGIHAALIAEESSDGNLP